MERRHLAHLVENRRTNVLAICIFMLIYSFFLVNFRIFRFKGDGIVRIISLGICFCIVIRYVLAKVKRIPAIILCFTVGALPSCFVSINRNYSFENYFQCVITLICLYYLADYMISMSYSSSFIEGIKWISIFCTVVGTILHVKGLDIGDMNRAQGITTNANTLGIYSYVALITMLYFAYNSLLWKKFFYYFMSLLNIWLILESGSRLAFLVMLGYLGIYFILITKDTRIKVIYPFLICFIIGIFVWKFNAIKAVFISKMLRLDDDGLGRFHLWKIGLDIWKEHKLLGCGLLCSPFLNEGVDIWSHFLPMHNSYVSLLAETGLVGTVLVAGSMVISIVRYIRRFFFDFFHNGFSDFLLFFLMWGGLFMSSVTESFLFASGATEYFLFWFTFFVCRSYVTTEGLSYRKNLEDI